MFEWNTFEGIDHSRAAVRAMQHFADFFAEEARQNSQVRRAREKERVSDERVHDKAPNQSTLISILPKKANGVFSRFVYYIFTIFPSRHKC